MEVNNNTTTKVEIEISPKTELTYTKPEEVGGGNGTLHVNKPIQISLSACKILIGKNTYVVVSKWIDEYKLPKSYKCILPEHTLITMENGIPVYTSTPMEVDLPKTFVVNFPAGTKLQQIDEPSVQLVLNTDCKATLVFDSDDIKEINKITDVKPKEAVTNIDIKPKEAVTNVDIKPKEADANVIDLVNPEKEKTHDPISDAINIHDLVISDGTADENLKIEKRLFHRLICCNDEEKIDEHLGKLSILKGRLVDRNVIKQQIEKSVASMVTKNSTECCRTDCKYCDQYYVIPSHPDYDYSFSL